MKRRRAHQPPMASFQTVKCTWSPGPASNGTVFQTSVLLALSVWLPGGISRVSVWPNRSWPTCFPSTEQRICRDCSSHVAVRWTVSRAAAGAWPLSSGADMTSGQGRPGVADQIGGGLRRIGERGEVTHLPSRLGVALAVEVEPDARPRQRLRPTRLAVLPEIAEQVGHGRRPQQIGRAERQAADRAELLLELAG